MEAEVHKEARLHDRANASGGENIAKKKAAVASPSQPKSPATTTSATICHKIIITSTIWLPSLATQQHQQLDNAYHLQTNSTKASANTIGAMGDIGKHWQSIQHIGKYRESLHFHHSWKDKFTTTIFKATVMTRIIPSATAHATSPTTPVDSVDSTDQHMPTEPENLPAGVDMRTVYHNPTQNNIATILRRYLTTNCRYQVSCTTTTKSKG